MLTVSILINGQPIYTRSAVNISIDDEQPQKYRLDTGEIILHDQKEGAVKLATEMLKTIKEQK